MSEPSPINAPFSPADHHFMALALALAEQAIGLSDPNPRVGCVLVGPGGNVIGQGSTQAAGQAHAEVMALRDASAKGHSTQGSTAFVTLEPCAHFGRTPPCCDALLQAGIARLVLAVEDPNPKVAGQGLGRLRAGGVRCEVGLMTLEATALNVGFLHRMRTGRPWVRLKWASSLDGRIALPDGRSQWITSAEARCDGHAWRRRAGAVLTGIGTALADNPRLDVREWPTSCQPLRVVLDRQLRLPTSARLLASPGKALLVHGPGLAAHPMASLQQAGADLWEAPLAEGGRLDLQAVLMELGRREVNELHVEAGGQLNGAWLAAGLVDELLLYLAPRLIGPGQPPAGLPPLADLAAARSWQWLETQAIGQDLRLRLRRPSD
jgi:diaminohydroxyphosphoribosylaminopyrimidine deaminase/5-amino-6-(5-phosphoribosylamino)uracil reductase